MIQVENLVKRYGSYEAVSHLTFQMEDHGIYGFLGPNGAGKSTTMNIMTGYLGPTEGTVIIDGYDILEEPGEAKRRIGYLPELPPVYMDMTVEEYLRFAAGLKGIAHSARQGQIDEAVKKCDLGSVRFRLIQNLSKGYRQRVGLAQALLGMPGTLVLDEPMVGLDPKQIIEMRDLLRDLAREHTVFLSSHILSEIQAVCDYILILSHGKLVASDTPENLEARMCGTPSLVLDAGGSRTALEKVLDEFRSSFRTPYRIESLPAAAGNGAWHVTLEMRPGSEIREELFYALAERKCPLYSMRREATSLEEVFLELTGGGTDEANPRAASGRGGKRFGKEEDGTDGTAKIPFSQRLKDRLMETESGELADEEGEEDEES